MREHIGFSLEKDCYVVSHDLCDESVWIHVYHDVGKEKIETELLETARIEAEIKIKDHLKK